MKNKTIYLIELIILILFTIFLISLIPEQESIETQNIVDIGKNSDKSQNIKFSVITKQIAQHFNNTKIGHINNKYLSKLIVENKISNRENTIAQELISLYKKNLTNEAINLSKEIIEPILDEYDTKKTRKWINYDFYFKMKNNSNETFHFYKQKNLLKNKSQSNTTANYSMFVKPYIYERYYFTLKNQTVETVDVNLITYQGEEKLSEYINLDTYKSKENVEKINSTFIESQIQYKFNFYIWN